MMGLEDRMVGSSIRRIVIGGRRHRHIEGQYKRWYNQGGNTNLNFFFRKSLFYAWEGIIIREGH